jgi:hypothetical protein
VKSIINEILNRNNVNESEKEEILDLIEVLEQNYIQINEQYYIQNEGLAMRALASAILTETRIQHLEDMSVVDILSKHHIMHYYTHVNDIIIICNTQKTHTMNTFD